MKPLKSKKINIMGQKWRLVVCKNPPPFKDNLDKRKITTDTDHGYCDRKGKLIWVNNTDDLEDQHSTFLHELIHAINTANDIKLSEHRVLIFESGLFQVLRANKIRFD